MHILNSFAAVYSAVCVISAQAWIQTATFQMLHNANEIMLQMRLLNSFFVWGPQLCSAFCLSNVDCDVYTVVKLNKTTESSWVDEQYKCLIHSLSKESGEVANESDVKNGNNFMLNRATTTTSTPSTPSTTASIPSLNFCETECNVSASFYDPSSKYPIVFCKENIDFYILDANDTCKIQHKYIMSRLTLPEYSERPVGVAFNLHPDVIALQDDEANWFFYRYNAETKTFQLLLEQYIIPGHIAGNIYAVATTIDPQHILLMNSSHYDCVNSADFEGGDDATEPVGKKKKKEKTNNGNGNGNNKKPKGGSGSSESESTPEEPPVCNAEWTRLKSVTNGGLELIDSNYYAFSGNKVTKISKK